MPDIQACLVNLYGEQNGPAVYKRLQQIMDRYRAGRTVRPRRSSGRSNERSSVSERDSILITYGDQVTAPGAPPLQTLADFCARRIQGTVSGVHILPFYPYSSDDGFSVIDYRAVDPRLGSWDDVAALGQSFRLMFDAVINHISAQSEWFKGFLRCDSKFSDYFITVGGSPDLSAVVRPRALPLLTRFETAAGSQSVWTTFSEDQVDLNYKNPDVLLEIIDLLLFYAERGAEFIRLDAIAYLWKEIGTSCIHLPQTHQVIQLFRAVLDEVFPRVLLITETNVPHVDNIAYFGDGVNEAQMVYNFALPPLVLHALLTGDTRALTRWAASLTLPSKETTFFNFLASHDGIGLNPARGILSDSQIDALVDAAQARGGLVSYKNNPDGSRSPYELNINYFDALSNPHAPEPKETAVSRFTASQAVMLSLAGVPGIYFHSLFGSRGWPEGARQTGRNRTINRQKLERAALDRELDDPSSRRSMVFERYRQMLKARAGTPAFHPNGSQQALDFGGGIFALLRAAPEGSERALCLINMTNSTRQAAPDANNAFDLPRNRASDLLTGQPHRLSRGEPITLEPYAVKWIHWNG